MGNPKTTIELNGRQYDAQTGKILSPDTHTPTSSAAIAPKQRAMSPQPGQILDGFTRRPNAKVKSHTPIVAAPTHQPIKVESSTLQQSTTTAKREPNSAVRKPQKSKTLMRPSVKKPAVAKNNIQPIRPTVPKPIGISLARIAKAEVHNRSPHVSKFGTKPTSVIKKEAVLPVVAPSLPAISKAVTNELSRLEHALEDANAHLHTLEDSMVKKVPFLRRVGFKNKAANLGAMTAAMLLLTGFFAYQNKAIIEMQVAASRSGVSASLPGYSPAGYAINGGVQSEPGKVSVEYKSRTNDKGFTITQKSSSWNSTALLANHVTKTRCNTCFQTWQNEGKTVYIYDNSNATWVTGGVWYTLEGNAELTSDQLLKVANSL